MPGLTTEQALAIILNARKRRVEIEAKPVAIAVVDEAIATHSIRSIGLVADAGEAAG